MNLQIDILKEADMFSKARILNFEKGTTQCGYAVKGRSGRNYRRESYGYCNGNGMYMSYPEPYLSVILYLPLCALIGSSRFRKWYIEHEKNS
jgi:hypothetical protein